jgi:hypothetical protein
MVSAICSNEDTNNHASFAFWRLALRFCSAS